MPLLRPSLGLVLVLFFVSGATGLVYEVTWVRRLTSIFGVSAFAVSTVLTSFMAGLALGSWTVGRRADRIRRPLAVYGLFEVAIGLFALATPWLFEVVESVHRMLYGSIRADFYTFSLLRFGLAFAVLIVPTTLMGATLPVLSRFVVEELDGVGQRIGRLYAVNTAGAVTGTVLAGFVTIATIGVKGSFYLAAVANLVLGLAAWTIGRRGDARELPPPSLESPLSPTARVAATVFGISGFCSLALQVMWTRVLALNMENSVYSFTIILAVFLTGLALGSWVYSRWLRKGDAATLLGSAEVGIGAFALASWFLFDRLPGLIFATNGLLEQVTLFRANPWWATVMVEVAFTAAVLLPPTVLMGATFPTVARIVTEDVRTVGRRVGDVYALNTVGSILGSFLTGFVLVPFVGLGRSFVAVAGINLCLGLVMWTGKGGGRPRAFPHGALVAVGVALLVAAGAQLASGPRQFIKESPWKPPALQTEKVLYYAEGALATVTVTQVRGFQEPSRLIEIDGVPVAGTSFVTRATQKVQGHLPLLIHPDPRHVLTVGFGSGETSYTLSLHPVDLITCVELNPEVIAAAPHFDDINHGVYATDREEIVLDDARTFLGATDRTFDLILNDSIHPGRLGNAALYTTDYFQACRARLAPGGFMSTWLPNVGLSDDDFRMILASMAEVFPHCYLWMVPNFLNQHPVLLGMNEPLRLDPARIAEKMSRPRVAEELADIHLDDVHELLGCLLMDTAAIGRYTQGSGVNSDDRPYLEFRTPRNMFENYWAQGGKSEMASDLAAFRPFLSSPVPLLSLGGLPVEEREAFERRQGQHLAATSNLLDGHIHKLSDRLDEAVAAYDLAAQMLPTWADPRRLASEARFQLLGRHMEREDWEGARAVAADLASADPKDARPVYTLGIIASRQGRADEAVALLEEARELDPGVARVHFSLALVYRARGDRAEAARSARRALELEPAEPGYRQLAEALGGR